MNRRIEEFHVFLVRDAEGDEQVAAYYDIRLKRMDPMIATSESRLEGLMEIAQDFVARDPSKPLLLTKFSSREDVAEVVLAPADPT